MRTTQWGLPAAGLVVALGAATPALAQDGTTFSFDLNSVLVATFEADQPFLEPESERVRGLVESALGDAYVVVRMAEVPPFTDYSADIYLRSCPAGQYIGCVFVVGGRAETDWTIGGRISAVEGGYQVDLSFIDVDEAKLVLEFDVVLDGSNDAEFQEGVVRVMDALVNGQVQDLDVRGDPEARRAAEAEAERRAAEARKFAVDSVYEDTQDLDRGDVGLDAYVGDVDRNGDRVTFDDLEDMEEAGGLPPWERAGLTKGQYKLYRNSGLKLRDFKRKLQGRKGEVLVRAGFKITSGPWGQAHHTGVLIAEETPVERQNAPLRGDILQQTALQFQYNLLTFGGELELGYGVTSFMDINAFFGVLGSRFVGQFFQEKNVEPRLVIPEPNTDQITSRASIYAGAKVGFAPMPAYPARPTLYVGAAYWQGSSINSVVNDIPATYVASTMPPNFMLLGLIQPGFEVNAGKTVVIFARADIDVLLPVGTFFQNQTFGQKPPYTRQGEFTQFYQQGGLFADSSTPGAPGPVGAGYGIGVGGTLGILLRFRVAGLR